MTTGASRKKRSQSAPGTVQRAVTSPRRARAAARARSPSAAVSCVGSARMCSTCSISSVRRPPAVSPPSRSEGLDILLLPGEPYGAPLAASEIGVAVAGALREQPLAAGREVKLHEVAEVFDDVDQIGRAHV